MAPLRLQGAAALPRLIGRVETQLLTFERVPGWCFDAWGEGSIEKHELVRKLLGELISLTCKLKLMGPQCPEQRNWQIWLGMCDGACPPVLFSSKQDCSWIGFIYLARALKGLQEGEIGQSSSKLKQ